jgi:hypothetical protein
MCALVYRQGPPSFFEGLSSGELNACMIVSMAGSYILFMWLLLLLLLQALTMTGRQPPQTQQTRR